MQYTENFILLWKVRANAHKRDDEFRKIHIENDTSFPADCCGGKGDAQRKKKKKKKKKKKRAM